MRFGGLRDPEPRLLGSPTQTWCEWRTAWLQRLQGHRPVSPGCTRSKDNNTTSAPPGKTPQLRQGAAQRHERSRLEKGLLASKVGWGPEMCFSGGAPPLLGEKTTCSSNVVHAEHCFPPGVWHLGCASVSPHCTGLVGPFHTGSPGVAPGTCRRGHAAGSMQHTRVRPLGGALEPACSFLQIRPMCPSLGCL